MRVLAVILAIFLIGCVSAKKKEKFDKLEELLEKTKAIEENNKAELIEEAELEDDEDDDEADADHVAPPKENPCNTHHCSWGKECVLNKKYEPRCVCATKCPDAKDSQAVCSSHNETFSSICELYRERCHCKSGDEKCSKTENKKVHLEYMGKCKALDECTEDMMEQFPERMSDWLFQVMKELNRREALHGDDWVTLANQAEADEKVRHVYPVIWKYCELNKAPHDKFVSHHELIPLIAPVMPMESCIKPFLNKCDQDDDRKISLNEWGTCLGLQKGDIVQKC